MDEHEARTVPRLEASIIRHVVGVANSYLDKVLKFGLYFAILFLLLNTLGILATILILARTL